MANVELKEPLPTIRIPLRTTDDDVLLEIQALVELAYENGSYQNDIDYRRPLSPRLSREDEEWANELLADKGLIDLS